MMRHNFGCISNIHGSPWCATQVYANGTREKTGMQQVGKQTERFPNVPPCACVQSAYDIETQIQVVSTRDCPSKLNIRTPLSYTVASEGGTMCYVVAW